jgi:hypothetical protein
LKQNGLLVEYFYLAGMFQQLCTLKV